MLEKEHITCFGAGAMGEALLRGLIATGKVKPEQITATDVLPDRLRLLQEDLGIRMTADNASAAKGATILILAVKPDVVACVMDVVGPLLMPHQLLISIAAGVRIEHLEAKLAQPVPVVRVMPNTPCLVGESAAALAAGSHATEAHLQMAKAVFESVGVAVVVQEKLLDAVTGLSGSGPAYVYVFIEALSDAGVRAGLPRAVAMNLAAQTVKGAAQMVLRTGKHPGVLKDMVTSPGGTTIAGIHELERGKFRATVMNAVEAATRRAKEISQS